MSPVYAGPYVGGHEPMTVVCDGEEWPFVLAPDGPTLGHVVGFCGGVPLHCEVGGEVWREYRHRPEVRAAFRACRRWLSDGGKHPLRMLVHVYDGKHDEPDTCEVYGWRAALTAARAMLADARDRDDRRRYGTRVVVLDAAQYRAALRSAGMDD